MSGGILLPGTAATTDVNSGKTFSSNAGFNLTGTATLVPSGTIVQSVSNLATASSSNSLSSITTSLGNGVTAGNSVIITAAWSIYNGNTAPAVSGWSGLGATWTTEVSQLGSGSIWCGSAVGLATGLTGGDTSFTFTLASATNVAAISVAAYEVVGTVTVDHTNGNNSAAEPWALNCNATAGDFVVGIYTVLGIGAATIVATNFGGASTSEQPWLTTYYQNGESSAYSQYHNALHFINPKASGNISTGLYPAYYNGSAWNWAISSACSACASFVP